MDIEVIYEDEALLAVNKPAGLAVHEDGRTIEPTLVDWVREHRPDMIGVGESMRLQNGTMIDRPGVVHRLDRDTSGILILAKTQEAFELLKQQFQTRKTEKLYHAFVWGEIKLTHGTVDRPIGRSRSDFRLWSAGSDAGGQLRAATTRYTVLAVRGGFSYLALEPKTGRTHQIRVHLKSIGHPVVGDVRYAPKKPLALGFERHALHAHTLALTHPNGTRLVLEAPFPDDFVHARVELGIQ
jgi:23S rRNA pseudouridine1911/1915/1917 synthase